MLLVRDAGEVPREFEAHAMTMRGRLILGAVEALVEKGDRHAQCATDFEEPAGRDAIDAPRVFVGLLVSDADHLGHLLLAQTQHHATIANPLTDVLVDTTGAIRRTCAGRPNLSWRVAARCKLRHDIPQIFRQWVAADYELLRVSRSGFVQLNS